MGKIVTENLAYAKAVRSSFELRASFVGMGSQALTVPLEPGIATCSTRLRLGHPSLIKWGFDQKTESAWEGEAGTVLHLPCQRAPLGRRPSLQNGRYLDLLDTASEVCEHD